MKRKIFAVQNDLMYFNTAHPIKQFKNNATGEYDLPDWQNIDGGAMHGNKNDVVVCYHRPNFVLNHTDPLCHLKVWKIKDHKVGGVPGTVEMIYDRQSTRYNEYNGSPTF